MAAVQKQTSHAPKGAAMINFNRLSTAIVVCTLAAAASVSAAELNGTLKKIQETGSITLGYRESSVPFSYLDADGNTTG